MIMSRSNYIPLTPIKLTLYVSARKLYVLLAYNSCLPFFFFFLSFAILLELFCLAACVEDTALIRIKSRLACDNLDHHHNFCSSIHLIQTRVTMRIGCLQFAPQLGDVNNNLNRADAVLFKADPNDMDLLVLPELAFSGKPPN